MGTAQGPHLSGSQAWLGSQLATTVQAGGLCKTTGTAPLPSVAGPVEFHQTTARAHTHTHTHTHTWPGEDEWGDKSWPSASPRHIGREGPLVLLEQDWGSELENLSHSIGERQGMPRGALV